MTLAMASAGVPHPVDAGADAFSQPWMLAVEAAAFLAAAGFLFTRLRESRARGSDLSPEAELARRAAGHCAEAQRPRF